MPNSPILWTPQSTVKLCKVNWDSSYKNVVEWDEGADKQTYFDSLDGYTFTNSAYMPANQPVAIDLPHSAAYKYNYCIVTNPEQPVDDDTGETFYYFVTDCRYVNPSTSVLTLQLDVWTTYIDTAKFGTAYVERGHLALANSACINFENIPRTLNSYWSIPDGLSTSDTFQTFYEERYSLQQDDDGNLHPDWVCIASTANLVTAFGSVESPVLKTATGGKYDGLFSGMSYYLINQSEFQKFIAYMSDYPWVSQCIVSMTSIPYSCYDDVPLTRVVINDFHGDIFEMPGSNDFHEVFGTIDMNNIRNKGWNSATLPYADIPKLWCYPYTVIEVTCNDGNAVYLKPELLPRNSTAIRGIAETVQPFCRIGIYPEGYNSSNAAYRPGYTYSYVNANSERERTITTGDFLDTALWIADFPQWSIVNNSYIAYMASTANTRQASYNSANWALSSALASANASKSNALLTAGTSYTNGYLSLNNDLENFNIGQETQQSNMTVNNLVGGISSAVSLNASGVAGTLTSQFTGNASLEAAARQMENTARTSSAILDNSMTAAMGVAGKNWELAVYAANGNNQAAIATIDAGYADAQLMPPSTVAQVGGNGFRYATGLMFSFAVRYKRVSDNAIKRNGDYFKRFGHAINRFVIMPQTLNLCSDFTYWKTQDVDIVEFGGDDTSRNAIRGILSQGVTVWSDPDKIGKVMPVRNSVDPDKIRPYYY